MAAVVLCAWWRAGLSRPGLLVVEASLAASGELGGQVTMAPPDGESVEVSIVLEAEDGSAVRSCGPARLGPAPAAWRYSFGVDFQTHTWTRVFPPESHAERRGTVVPLAVVPVLPPGWTATPARHAVTHGGTQYDFTLALAGGR